MPILKKYHRYVNKYTKKGAKYIGEIIPTEDREVSERMFNEFQDVTGKEIELEV